MKNKYSLIKKRGFTLIELILVISVGLAISFMSFQRLVQENDNTIAKMAGQQISQIGESVNSYIAVHYDTLSTLTNSTGSSTDPGPRTCSSSTSSCSITLATLVNEGLLPSTYGSTNVFKSGYSIVLKRSGSSPYYNITGMITTSNPWIGANNAIRYDLLGKAMQSAGIDSGMTRLSASQMNGYNGNWLQNTTDYSNINKLGQLGYQVGYGTYSYSIYLRRDGTLPMTGNLNMGGQDINNVDTVNASGSIYANGLTASSFYSSYASDGGILAKNAQVSGTFGAGNATSLAAYMNSSGNIYAKNNINSGWEVIAHNGNGDAITLGGDAAGGTAADYELRLGSNKTLVIYSPNSTQYSTVLNVNRNAIVNERLSTNGYSPNDIPTGWGGGLRTFDVVASGTVALIKNGTSPTAGNLAAYMNLNGDIYASNSINSAGSISASGNISGNGIYGNYLQSNGSIYSAGATTSNGRLTANEYVQVNGVGTVGNGCSPNGLVGRSSSGQVISCVNGVWRSPVSTSIYYNSAQASAFRFPSATAYCNGNDVAVGGGGYCSAPSGFIWITGTYPVGTNGWYVSCDQNNKDPVSYVTTFVKCQSSN